MNDILIISILISFTVTSIILFVYFFYLHLEKRKTQRARIEEAINLSRNIFTKSKSNQGANQDPNDVSLIVEEKKEEDDGSEDNEDIRKDHRVSNIDFLNDLLIKLESGKIGSIKCSIEQAGLKIKTLEFLMMVIGLTIAGILFSTFVLKVPLVGGAVGIVPFIVLGVLKQKRLDAFIKELPQALDVLQSDLRAGLDVQAGIKHLGEEFMPPLGEEFAKVNIEVGLGLSLAEALINLSNRVNSMDVQILCTGIIINRELGGNLGEVIKNIGDTIKERFKLKGMVKSLTAENEASAYLLTALPVGMFFMLNNMSPAVYQKFLSEPTGRFAISWCVLSTIIGFTIIKKMTKLDV